MEQLDVDDVRMALKEFVIGLNSSHNLSTSEEIKNCLLHLEETDENFHKYSLIKIIRSSVENVLGQLIDTELEQSEKFENVSEMKVEERITESTMYKNYFDQLSSHMREAESDLKENFDAELLPFFMDARDHVDNNATGRSYSCLINFGDRIKKTEILYSACDSPEDDSSSSQDTAMFLTNDSLAEIANSLNKKNSLETRQSALRSLLINSSVLDLPHPVWPPIREELLEILLNFNGVFWVQALKVIARGLNGTSPSCAKEMFQILIDVLMAQFPSEEEDHENIEGCDGAKNDKDNNDDDEKEIDLSGQYNERLLRAFRLLAQYIQQLSQKPTEKNTLDSFKGLLLLLSIKRSGYACLSPFQFLSLVDPRAAWFSRAMHGNHTRNLIVHLIGERNHLLINCVQHCLKSFKRIQSGSLSTNGLSDVPLSGGIRRQVETCSVMVSIKIVAGLTTCMGGRDLFPVTPEKNHKEVNLQEMVIIMMKIFFLSPLSWQDSTFRLKISSTSLTAMSPDISSVSLECLKRLCQVEEACRTCMCHPGIIEVLLEPLCDWLDNKTLEVNKLVRILKSCDVIDSLAMTESGRRWIISGSNGFEWKLDDNSGDVKWQAPIKTIFDFTTEILNLNQDAKGHSRVIMRSIQGRLLQTVRVFSGSCEGVIHISEHRLHLSLMGVFAEVTREIENLATPTPGSLEVNLMTLANDKESLMELETALSDSLLNLLTTPKGLWMVSQMGIMKDCVCHMCITCNSMSRDQDEKSNYWFLSSQISTIPAGMMALSDCGFISLLVNSLWSDIETTADVTPPSIVPSSVCSQFNPAMKQSFLCCTEKFPLKTFNSLVNVLCSFSSLSRLLLDQNLPSKTSGTCGKFMPPQTIVGLLDRLVIVHTDFKIKSLYSYEESHLCGLRLINLLLCCLDTYCLIQSQYDIIKVILSCQRDNVAHENSKEIIIDSLSVMRNHILVRSYLIGGPNERILPPKDFSFNFFKSLKFFCDYPVPECYLLKTNRKYGTDILLATPSVKNPCSWIDFKKSVVEMLVRNPNGVKDEIAMTALEYSLEYLLAQKGEVLPSDVTSVLSSAAKRFSFSKVQQEGMNLIIRYGKSMKLWNLSGKESMERLKMAVAKVTMVLRKKFKLDGKGGTSSNANGSGFDWFLASIFLVSNGNTNRTVRFLTKLSSLPLSISYWAHHMSSVTGASSSSMTDKTLCMLNHNFEVALQNELPQVYSAFKLSGLAPGLILQQWSRQCFLNYLDWPQIQQYLVICICLGPDYSVYFCLALLKHLEDDIKKQMTYQNLSIFLREEPIRNFHLDQSMSFMQSLEEKYRPTFIKDLLASLEDVKT